MRIGYHRLILLVALTVALPVSMMASSPAASADRRDDEQVTGGVSVGGRSVEFPSRNRPRHHRGKNHRHRRHHDRREGRSTVPLADSPPAAEVTGSRTVRRHVDRDRTGAFKRGKRTRFRPVDGARFQYRGKYYRWRRQGERFRVLDSDGLPTDIPGIGTYAGSIDAARDPGNGTYFDVEGNVYSIPAEPVDDSRAKIIDASPDGGGDPCEDENGVCVIRP